MFVLVITLVIIVFLLMLAIVSHWLLCFKSFSRWDRRHYVFRFSVHLCIESLGRGILRLPCHLLPVQSWNSLVCCAGIWKVYGEGSWMVTDSERCLLLWYHFLCKLVDNHVDIFFKLIPVDVNNTHTHLFNGPFSGTTQVSQYQKGKTNLDFTEARDSEWQWHQLGHMPVCTSLQTDNHATTPPLSFLQAGCPSCCPANSIKALGIWCE